MDKIVVMLPSPGLRLLRPPSLTTPEAVHFVHLVRLTGTLEQLKAVVHACRCFTDGQFEQAVGIALEARRLDKLEQTIKSSPDMVKILTYSLQVCQTLVISREFRQQVKPSICWDIQCPSNYQPTNKHLTLCRCCGFSSSCMKVSQTLTG